MTAPTAGSLCSGYGGLDLAVAAVLGELDLVWVADNDPGAAAILACRFPGVPNLGDLTRIPWPDVPAVEVLLAGFPCQPVSAAGSRRGLSDDRWLFDDIAAGLGRMDPRPRLCVFENVPGLLTANGGAAMARVVHSLAKVGYVGRWRTLAAADVGAPHRRDRVFILAQDADGATGDQWRQSGPGQEESRRAWADAGRRGRAPAIADADGWEFQRQRAAAILAGEVAGTAGARITAAWDAARSSGPDAADADGAGLEITGRGLDVGSASAPERTAEATGRRPATGNSGDAVQWGPYGRSIARWEYVTGRPAPSPTEPGRTGHRLSPRFVEWMMGLPDGWVTDVPGLARKAQLKALGNGVVPQQAAAALALLLEGEAAA